MLRERTDSPTPGTYTILLHFLNLINNQNNAQTLCCVAYYLTLNQMHNRKFGMGSGLFHSPFPYGDRKNNLFSTTEEDIWIVSVDNFV